MKKPSVEERHSNLKITSNKILIKGNYTIFFSSNNLVRLNILNLEYWSWGKYIQETW